MKFETFFEKFDLFADAPDAVAKLRELFLRLAVQGMLVPQDVGDDPAEELLRHIESIRSGKGLAPNGRRVEAQPPIDPADFPFAIPRGWAWCRLGSLGLIGSSCRVHEKEWTSTGVPFLRAREIVKLSKSGQVDNDLFITEEHYQQLATEGLTPEPNDIMITGVGTIGVPYIVRGADRFYFKDASVLIFKNCFDVFPDYLNVVMRSSYWIQEIHRESMGTTVHTLTIARAKQTPIPLPPLPEQKRIVAKVDELMALCDRLEAQQQDRESRERDLARAALARFAEGPTPANLDLLFHQSFAVPPADLRKSILTLAVQGRLVPQDPNDEPAEKMVERIAAGLPDKKSENPFLGEIEASITDESEFDLPAGWTWLPLGHIGIWATGCGFPTQYQGESDREFLFCKVSDMNLPGNEVEITRTVHTIDVEVMKKIRARANPAGTVIFPKIGGAIATHKRRLVIQPTIIDNNCSGIQPIGLTDNRWLLMLMRSIDLTKYQSGTSVPAVSQSSLDPIRVGLPPLAEQKRIVAKVDELMALVDQLEAQQAAARATAEKLLEAAVAELTTQ